MVAVHYFASEVQEPSGSYTHHLRRVGDEWQISRYRLVITWERGSCELFARAKARGPRSRIDVTNKACNLRDRIIGTCVPDAL
jgi:hypothetical protein